ncbi:MAG: hypothetical protein J6Q54_04865 [Oscillospiraceae bacterium]|nr:hypothetical protein [Oscillospiraceae bacterium]
MTQLKAGYAKADITPSFPVPLGGYGKTHCRIHDSVESPICAVCVAISDGVSTILLYHLDLVGLPNENVARCKKGISEATGVPEDNILLNATHTHSAPDLRSNLDSIAEYTKILEAKIIGLAAPALADLENASLEIGSAQVENLNFVRRYLLSDGTYGGDNFGDFKNNTILGHETEADHCMQVVRLVRQEKKDILLVNWQAHPHPMGGTVKKYLTADIVGKFRAKAEEEHDILFAFYQGCAGNINSHSRIEGEGFGKNPIPLAEGLAAGLTKVLGKMRPVKAGPVRVSTEMFSAPINHEWDDKVEDARDILSYWQDKPHWEVTDYARSKGFNSVFHASAVIRRSTMADALSYRIGAVSFGDVCIVWAPNELFDATGLFLKSVLPYEMIFACGYTNGSNGYMPTMKAFHHGGYGCDTCNYPAGTTEVLMQAMYRQGLAVR